MNLESLEKVFCRRATALKLLDNSTDTKIEEKKLFSAGIKASMFMFARCT